MRSNFQCFFFFSFNFLSFFFVRFDDCFVLHDQRPNQSIVESISQFSMLFYLRISAFCLFRFIFQCLLAVDSAEVTKALMGPQAGHCSPFSSILCFFSITWWRVRPSFDILAARSVLSTRFTSNCCHCGRSHFIGSSVHEQEKTAVGQKNKRKIRYRFSV